MMQDEKKVPLHPETFFLPPLNMVLTFFDKASNHRESKENIQQQEDEVNEKDVKRIISRLNEQDQPTKRPEDHETTKLRD